MLAIELLDYCNFECYFCKNTKEKRIKNILTLMDIKKLIPDIIKLNIEHINLTPSTGEIFLHPEIYEILELFCNIKNIKIIRFFTNFSLIDIKKFKKIYNNKFQIYISIYGNNVSEFLKLTNSNIKNFSLIQKNIEEAKKLNININIENRPITYNYFYKNKPKDKMFFPLAIKNSKQFCKLLLSPRIMADGNFIACMCSGDFDDMHNSKLIIGNIKKESFFNLYLSGKRYELINNQLNNNCNNFCLTCDHAIPTYFNLSLKDLKRYNITYLNYKKDKEL